MYWGCQMADSHADKSTTAWKMVKAQPWEAVGLDPKKGPRSLALSLRGTKDEADPAVFLEGMIV